MLYKYTSNGKDRYIVLTLLYLQDNPTVIDIEEALKNKRVDIVKEFCETTPVEVTKSKIRELFEKADDFYAIEDEVLMLSIPEEMMATFFVLISDGSIYGGLAVSSGVSVNYSMLSNFENKFFAEIGTEEKVLEKIVSEINIKQQGIDLDSIYKGERSEKR